MSNLGSQLSLFSLLCADFLKSLTPTSMIRHNLKNILICNRSNFKPIVNSFNTLGVSRYFWECFDSAIYRSNCIEWYYHKRMGRLNSKSNYELLPMLANLVSYKNIPHWKCDIQTITNVCASKSKLSDFNNLDDLITKNSRELISEISLDNLSKNMRHYESKIFHQETEIVSCELWSKKFTWHNCGGSHHFMAARYIANKLKHPVPLTAKLEIAYIDQEKFDELFSKYELFLFSRGDSEQFQLLFDTLCYSRTTFLLAPISYYFSLVNDNEAYKNLRLLAFYKNDISAEPIINMLKNSSMLHLYRYFYSLISKQENNEQELHHILYL